MSSLDEGAVSRGGPGGTANKIFASRVSDGKEVKDRYGGRGPTGENRRGRVGRTT